MSGKQHKQKRLAQNFFKDPLLVRRLVQIAKFDPSDIVYEIGPGRGIITAELARRAARVVAVEKDRVLAQRLRERFRGERNVEIVDGDFLDLRVSRPSYKIFANIPYNATAAIVRKILWTPPAPVEAFLVMQLEPARKFSGLRGETLFSVLAKPYFDFRIAAHLKRTDFVPVPDVDSVLMRIRRREDPRVSRKDSRTYRDFVTLGFDGWKPNLRTAYKRVLTYTQWKRLSRNIGFPLDATPSQLRFEQWLRLYEGFRKLSG